MNTKVLGICGEVVAANFLRTKGYKILATNFVNKLGEIDIIAEINGIIVFVEVKARSSFKFGMPGEAVTFYKQNKIKQIALSYLKSTINLQTPCRFDVIEIIGNRVRQIENAF